MTRITRPPSATPTPRTRAVERRNVPAKHKRIEAKNSKEQPEEESLLQSHFPEHHVTEQETQLLVQAHIRGLNEPLPEETEESSAQNISDQEAAPQELPQPLLTKKTRKKRQSSTTLQTDVGDEDAQHTQHDNESDSHQQHESVPTPVTTDNAAHEEASAAYAEALNDEASHHNNAPEIVSKEPAAPSATKEEAAALTPPKESYSILNSRQADVLANIPLIDEILPELQAQTRRVVQQNMRLQKIRLRVI